MKKEVLVGIGAPYSFVLVVIEILIFLHFVQQFYFDFVIRMGKGAILIVLASLFIHIALAVFGFVS